MKVNKILYLILPVLMLLTVLPIYGQGEMLLKGQVTSSTDGSSLPGAAVVELDKNNRVVRGTMTDINGNYALMISNPNNKIQVTFIGFEKKIEDINGRNVINITLEESVTVINEINIYAEKKTNTGIMEIADRDLAIPVEKMSTRDIEDVQASSIDEAIQGRLAGVDIVSNSGDPGGGMSIRIRGVNTLSHNSQPLIVVDNIPYSVEISEDFDFGTANEEGYSQMLNIAVDDISEITVLKDAAATALWGTKAANGVLMVTTKRGSRGRKPIVSYTYRGTLSLIPDVIPMLNGDQYSTLILEEKMNVNGLPLNTQENREFLYDPSDPYYYYNYGQNTNWLDAMQQRGITHNHSFSIAGGGEKAAYRFSTNYEDSKGTTIGTGLKKLNTRLNLDYSISDKLKLVADFAYSNGDRQSNYDKDIRSIAYRKMPNMSIYEYDVDGNQTPNFFSPSSNIQGTYKKEGSNRTYNPVAMAEYGEKITKDDRIDSKFGLDYKILKGLNYRFDVSFAMINEKINTFLPQIAIGKHWTDEDVNRATDYDKDEYNIYTNNQISYINTFADIHELVATFQISTNDYRKLEYSQNTTNTASSLLKDPSVDSRVYERTDVGVSSGYSQVRSNGILGMFQYKLLDRYILAAGIRREGNSKFSEKYRYGFFPSLSLAWRLSGEPFMAGIGFLDDLRLKLSYGQNGKTPDEANPSFSQYGTFDWSYLYSTAVYPINMALVNLKWENFITQNIGIITEMFDRRMIIDLEFYKNRTEDMLGKIGITTVTGYEGINTNVGTMENIGWDFSFRSTVVRRNDLNVRFNLNLARNYNIMREVSEDYLIQTFTPGNDQFVEGIVENSPMGSFYGYIYDGVYKDESELIATDVNGNPVLDANGTSVKMIYDYPVTSYEFQPGDAKYRDINHDGNINYQDVVYLGDANPDFTGGFGSIIEYKNLLLNVYFHSRVGNSIVNKTQMYGENMYGYDNQTTAVLRRWRKPGDETDIPRALMNTGYNWMGSSRYVYDGSFLRMKYVTLTYTLPNKFVTRFRLSKLKISTTLNNMLTFTNYPGQDPEVTIKPEKKDKIYAVGYDKSNTPRTKEITVNVNVTF